RAGPFHSQSLEVIFSHIPGLKVVYPSNPEDAKGLLCEAIRDPNPVIFFEHKLLYRSTKQEIYDDYFNIEIGKARAICEGSDISVITYGLGVRWAEELQKNNPDISFYILDLRTLLPFDKLAILEAVQATNRVIVLTESTLSYGISAEIAAFISEACFEFLDAPVMRVASLDTPIPFAAALEDQFLPVDRLQEALENLLSY
ncbi:MAG: alpha-ketoacid dehydrogenase subunit beta, partial [Bdellovibrionales bacterium]|nr:alpha-ketoacid dehydrogenase subunit beta [Bdellovibrionales bacterium]